MNDTCGRLLLFVIFFYFAFISGTVSLCYSSCPEIQSLDQAGFELIDPPAFAPRVLRLRHVPPPLGWVVFIELIQVFTRSVVH